MGFGPVGLFTLDSVDMQAPGVPGLSGTQVNNTTGAYTVNPPLADSDGSPLTGLTFAEVVIIQADNATASAFVDNFQGAKDFPGAQIQTPTFVDTATAINGNFGISSFGPYSVLARCADHAP